MTDPYAQVQESIDTLAAFFELLLIGVLVVFVVLFVRALVRR